MIDPTAQTGLPWTKEDGTFWQQEIERARKKRVGFLSKWDATGNLESYARENVRDSTAINANKDFADVERKTAALWFDLPQIALVGDPGETPPPALLLHQEYLNALMGPEYMDVKATVRQSIQDALVIIQPALTEIGYHATTVTPEMPPQPGSILGLNTAPPTVVHETFFWAHLSPRASLIPADFRSTKYDDAPWIGYDFTLPTSQVRKMLNLPPTWKGGGTFSDKPYFDHGQDDNAGEPLVSGSKIWYRACLRDPSVVHPLVTRQFVLLEGETMPREHKRCPYHEIDLQTGRMRPDAMTGYPCHPLALRDLTDSAYVQADLSVVSPLTKELNKFRSQMLQRRDASRLHVLYDSGLVDADMRAKIESNIAPRMIPALPGTLAQGKDNIMLQVPNLELGRENYISQDIIERDRAAVFGIRANQQGSTDKDDITATEASLAQRNMDARFEQERQRDQTWFLVGAQKLSALVLRYGDRMALEVLGQQKGAEWIAAKQQGAFNRFRFRIVMNSGAYMDAAERMGQLSKVYNLTGKDPQTQRGVVLEEMATVAGLDGSRWLAVTPPEKEPEPPALSFSVKPEDLNPALPSYVGTFAILSSAGVKNLPPPMVPAVPPAPTGLAVPDGTASKMPRLDQKSMDLTGEMSGPKVMGG